MTHDGAYKLSTTELAELLAGLPIIATAGLVVFCDGIEIGFCNGDGLLVELACPQARHSEERLKKTTSSMDSKVSSFYRKALDESTCPMCKGDGSFPVSGETGRMARLMALSFGRYAGIVLDEERCKELLPSHAHEAKHAK